MSIYLINALSGNMVSPNREHMIRMKPISAEQVAGLLGRSEWISAVGHADFAALLSRLLGIEVPTARINVDLKTGDRAVLAQYSGPRLPEGATALPEGAAIIFFQVDMLDPEFVSSMVYRGSFTEDEWAAAMGE